MRHSRSFKCLRVSPNRFDLINSFSLRRKAGELDTSFDFCTETNMAGVGLSVIIRQLSNDVRFGYCVPPSIKKSQTTMR